MEQSEHTLQARLEGKIISKILLMRGFTATIESYPNISQKRYAVLAAALIKDDPSIINIAAAPDLVVRYVYPLEPNKAVLGFDYRKSKEQLKEVDRTRFVNGTILTSPVNLVQGGQGLILRSPVYTIDTVTELRTFWGIVSIVIDIDFLDETLRDDELAIPLEIALRKTTESTNAEAFYGRNYVFQKNPLLTKIYSPNDMWTMGIIPKGGWPSHADNYVLFRILLLTIGGVLFLIACYAWRLFGKRRDAELIMASAIEAIDGGFVLYSADDVFVTCNNKYKEIYNLSYDLFVAGVEFEHIIREGMKRGEYPAISEQKEEWIEQRLQRHKMANITEEHQLPNGRWILVSERKLADNSRVGIHIDVTELKLAKEAAIRANKAKSDFLSTLSHELRTPLTIILGYAQFLHNSKKLPAVKELHAAVKSSPIDADEIKIKLANVMDQVIQQSGKISESGAHLLTLITEILDYSKAEAGEMIFHRQMIPVGSFMESIVEQFKSSAKQKNLHLSYQSNGETVFADEMRIKQILINLVGNALKFTEEGSVTIKTQQKGAHIEFSVEDTGCGIPENKISAVFTEFYQVDGSDTRSKNGTGLGLSIVKRMVELQGGEVTLTSILGKGSIFSFTLPSNEI